MDRILVPVPEAHWRYGVSYKPGEIEWSPWIKNTICRGYGDLVGALLMTLAGATMSTSYNTPLYIAIGEGMNNGDWDTVNGPPAPNPLSTKLVAELSTHGRHIAVPVGFRQGEPPLGSVIGTPQSLGKELYRPIFSASWNAAEGVSADITAHPNGPVGLREVGLFGGPGSNTKNGGLLLNLLNYPVQVRDTTDPYILYWEVEFKIKWSENG